MRPNNSEGMLSRSASPQRFSSSAQERLNGYDFPAIDDVFDEGESEHGICGIELEWTSAEEFVNELLL